MTAKSKTHKKPITHSSQITITPLSPSDFTFRLFKIAVAQICQATGFTAAQPSALHTLTEIAGIYLNTLGKTAASYSNASGRTESNLFDLLNALHDLCSIQGFAGAGAVQSCQLSSSGVLKDIKFFVDSIDEMPFAKPIPNKCDPVSSLSAPAWLKRRGGKHIPKWLPGFPEESTEKVGGEKRRKFGLWESSDLVRIGGGGGGGFVGGGGDLEEERERVRFKIGGGKKVVCLNNVNNGKINFLFDNDDDDEVLRVFKKGRRR